MAQREEFRLQVPHQGVEHVTARVDRPSAGGARAVYVLAHGAGAPLSSEFLEEIAPRIADVAGIHVLRFNYAYSELMVRTGKRRPPERKAALHAVHGAAVEHAREAFDGLPVLGGGKSLGGRMATMMAADGVAFDGLVLLGYPLHPAGKPDRLRTDHFAAVSTPALFLQGTRDALARMTLVEEALPLWAGESRLHVVEGADHGFSVLRRDGRTQEEVLDEIAQAIAGWVQERFPAPGTSEPSAG